MLRIGLFIVILLAAARCIALNEVSIPVMTVAPTEPSSAQPTSPPAPDGWEILAPGLERRTYTPAGSPLGQLLVLRIDPAFYTFAAHYQPGVARSANEWMQTLPGALAFVNANFFREDFTINGFLVSNGIVYGQSYPGYGGIFQVRNGQARVRSNELEPYTGETLEQAVQAFPMLVLNGAASYSDTRQDRITRRTVIGQDSSGRILLMATPNIGLRLVDLSSYLPTTDMDLVNAFNLDGGGSTMLVINTGAIQQVLPSLDPVPAVLAVYAR